MNSIIIWLIIGLGVYLLFFRKGGMGCCGGHRDQGQKRQATVSKLDKDAWEEMQESVIDLKEEDYTVITSDSKRV